MTRTLTCPRGHRWESDAEGAGPDELPEELCPVCTPATVAVTPSALHRPADAAPLAGTGGQAAGRGKEPAGRPIADF